MYACTLYGVENEKGPLFKLGGKYLMKAAALNIASRQPYVVQLI